MGWGKAGGKGKQGKVGRGDVFRGACESWPVSTANAIKDG